jgi:DDE family transposase
VRPAASTWSGSAWILSACGRLRGDLTGANPVDRGKAGSKLHLAGEADGLPLSLVLSAANGNDSTMLEAVLDDIPAIRMPTERRRRRPGKVHADKAVLRSPPLPGISALARHPPADRPPSG